MRIFLSINSAIIAELIERKINIFFNIILRTGFGKPLIFLSIAASHRPHFYSILQATLGAETIVKT